MWICVLACVSLAPPGGPSLQAALASQVTPASRESRLPGSTLIVCLAASEAHPRLDYHKNTETFLQSTPLPNLLLHFFSPVLLPLSALLYLSFPVVLFQYLSHALLPAQPSHSLPSVSLHTYSQSLVCICGLLDVEQPSRETQHSNGNIKGGYWVQLTVSALIPQKSAGG